MDEPPDDEHEERGLGPLPASPEHGPVPPTTPAVQRSALAPDWWQPGLTEPPPGALSKSFRVEKGRAVSLHAMGVGETLDAAFKLYRSSWKIFVGTAAILIIPLNFIEAFLTRTNLGVLFNVNTSSEISPPGNTAIAASFGFSLITFLIVNPFLTALFARVTSEIYLGAVPEWKGSMRYARSKIGSILLITLLTGLAVFGGFLLFIIPAIIFYVRFAFSTATLVVEDVRGRKAMGRSWRLAKGHFWRLFGTLLLITVITTFITGAIGLPLTLAAQAIGPSAWPLAGLGNAVASVIARPLVIIAVVVLYFDLRVRKEGFDISLMVDELADGASSA